MLINSNLLDLIIGLFEINASITENQSTTFIDFDSSLIVINPPIKGLKKPKKVTKSKRYYILKDGEELNTFKIIFYNVVSENIIKGKQSTKRSTALLVYYYLD